MDENTSSLKSVLSWAGLVITVATLHVFVFTMRFPPALSIVVIDTYYKSLFAISTACTAGILVALLLVGRKCNQSLLSPIILLSIPVLGGMFGGQLAHHLAAESKMVSSFHRCDYKRVRAILLEETSRSVHRHREYLQVFPDSIPEYASDILIGTANGWGQGGTFLSLSYTVPEASWRDIELLFEKFGEIPLNRVKAPKGQDMASDGELGTATDYFLVPIFGLPGTPLCNTRLSLFSISCQ